jgi:hypothetical protein
MRSIGYGTKCDGVGIAPHAPEFAARSPPGRRFAASTLPFGEGWEPAAPSRRETSVGACGQIGEHYPPLSAFFTAAPALEKSSLPA